MIQAKDIKLANFVLDKMNFTKAEKPPIGRNILKLNINTHWKIKAFHKEETGAQIKIVYSISCDAFDGTVEGTLIVQFNRKVPNEEMQLLDSQKICVLDSVDPFIILVSEAASKMGFSSFLVDKKLIVDMINGARS